MMSINMLLFCLGIFSSDKIEKQGVLLNSVCSSFGTRCKGSTNLSSFYYGVNEQGIRLYIEISEQELMKQPELYALFQGTKEVFYVEPFELPNEVCSRLNCSKGFSLPPGKAQLSYKNKIYRLILLE